MSLTSSRAVAFQRSGGILLDTIADPNGKIEDTLRRFGELTSAAGSMHTYQITELSLWSAASSGLASSDLIDVLSDHSAMYVPGELLARVSRFFERYGQLWLDGEPGSITLRCEDPLLLRETSNILGLDVSDGVIPVPDQERGSIKAKMAEAGYPIVDRAWMAAARATDYELEPNVTLRPYQADAVERFVEHAHSGGVVLLPCGAGKTVVGVAIGTALGMSVLVVTPNRTIGEQWAQHFLKMTTLGESDISLFPDTIEHVPVSIVTYQSLTSHRDGIAARLRETAEVPWGLIVYDEVHTLPADVFRQSASLQSRRKLGLTATLVREDGREREVYALVGPPVWQSRWRELEHQGWISPVECYEVRVRTDHDRSGEGRELQAKVQTAERLVKRHENDRILIAAHRLKEVRAIAKRLNIPAITGETPQGERKELYERFRDGDIPVLAVSRVANVGVDLPDANVLIQLSGTFGSRLEEAQRLGRLLRPKIDSKPARFYSLVLPNTREREFAERRQRFLVEQGYRYHVVNTRSYAVSW